ncbi:glycoside hydrolase family 43 protein [Reichenbachiella ulvae]|uniref:Glycoside hydrolase family 43 protein n=1 Tax=Reichenbachiella ulvae TaxID=2980104 RepID=A0ABT3CTD9_9BACT|nr:glycoside hydrolase family 43 protein [Reichenbachiella ulvae]MCV9386966.1 glycoside hydrolase family 43 protein [Reichenbachiella ulvae]
MTKNINYLIALILFAVIFTNCQQKKAEVVESTTTNTFTNPILAGFYPDPSICKAEDKFYLITSSFAYYPGIPIFESDDLVNWKQIGHAIDRPEQMNFNGQGTSRGLFAPAISYHQGKYYIVCTHVDKGGNFIITADNPAGPWSQPTYLPKLNGIDPSLYFEGDKLFIVYNSIPPNNESLYEGHRTIRMFELDINTFETLGEEKLLVNGGVDLSKKPVWIEAPHLYHINDYYYLMCAEGGTAYDHSEVIFRSKNVDGPFEPWDQNPILTQRHLNPARPNPVTTSGHADIVEVKDGEWWAVFLACRPYGDNFYNIGRETFMTPVSWTDGWPVINPDFEEIQYQYPTPLGNEVEASAFSYSGIFSFKDEFEGEQLDMHYLFLRTPEEKWYHIKDGQLSLQLRNADLSSLSNPSYIAHRQQHHEGSASVGLTFEPIQEGEMAGLAAFQSAKNYYLLAKTMIDGKSAVALYQSNDSSMQAIASAPLTSEEATLDLKINFDKENYSFYYKEGAGEWTLIKDQVDGTFLSTQVAGGFVGSTIGMYAFGKEGTDNQAQFDYYEYQGDDQVFKSL